VDASRLVEVRYARLSEPVAADLLAQWLGLLSAEERTRAGRFVAETDRSAYVASHALLRLSLSRLADVPPEGWTFETGPHGKPEVAGDEASLGLRISLSHTRGFAVCAVSSVGLVGVDVEHAGRKAPLRISETCFAPAEREALAALPEADRGGRFFEHWTLKEAFLKAVGLGLTYPLERLSFSVGESPRVLLPEDLGEIPEDWRFDSWLIGGEFRIGLAAKTLGTFCLVTLTDASLCPPSPTF
jgi:4'-phosphopantetheinyl transferase